MAGGHGSPVQKLRNLSKTELLLHKVAMNRLKNRPRKASVEKKPSTIHPGREFVLEDHKLKNKVDQLEKEKQQWIHKHKDDAHTFRMSVRLPPQCGQEYWTQYGENFHANGDFRESYCLRLPPRPSPKQQFQSRKERQASGDISNNNKSRPCTTVSDLISMMRETAPSTACPLSSSSMTGVLSNQNLDSAESESLEKLRVLLENYEMFVPSDSDVEDEEEDDKTWQNVVPENDDKQSRSKSVDDIKKVELGVSKERANRLTRSQSAQTNQGIQSQQRFRKRNSAPARDIAHGALRVHALQPSLCKFDIKNYSVTKSSTTFFQSPSKRVLERKEESSCSPLESNAKRTDLNDNDRFQNQTPRRIDTKSKHTDSSVKEGPVDRNNSPEGFEKTSRVKKRQKGSTDKEKDAEETDKRREESSYNITYSFSDSRDVIESYSNAGEAQPVRKSFARVTAGYQREATTMSRMSRMSRDSRSRNTRQESSPKSKRDSEGLQSGKLSIKNLIPEFPLDLDALRRASRKSVTSVNDDSNSSPKQQLHWRPKPKSASSFAKKRPKSTAHDLKEMNKQPEHLTHGSVKARRTAIMVLGKGLIDKKKQEKETRDKMNQFFARLKSTNGETSELHAAAPTRPNTAILLRSKERSLKKQEYQRKTEKMYKRAAPWPVQVWC